MTAHLPILVLLATIVPAVCMPLLGMKNRAWCRPVALASLWLMSLLSVATFIAVYQDGPIPYALGGWEAPVGVAWLVDGPGALMVVSLGIVVSLSMTASGPRSPAPGASVVPYYALILLLVSGATGIIFAADLFNVFVFLEVAALAGYALAATGGGPALMAAFRYLILGSLGASLYLLAIAYLYAATGTLNMADLAIRLPPLLDSRAVLAGVSFMFIGLGIKSALVPFHGWLPDAYTHAPEAVTPVLAAVVTKVVLFTWIRIMFWVLGAGVEVQAAHILDVLWILGAAGAVVGALLALSQRDLKRMFALGGISHIALTLVGVGQGNQTGLVGGLFYLVNDAFMQAGLFVLAGAAIHKYGVRTWDDLGKLRAQAPWLVGALIVIATSMVGLPPTGGFFGKWYILLSALEAGNYLAVAAVAIATVLTLAYFIKLFEAIFRGPRAVEGAETPTLPLSFKLAVSGFLVGIVGFGLISDSVVAFLLQTTSGLNL